MNRNWLTKFRFMEKNKIANKIHVFIFKYLIQSVIPYVTETWTIYTKYIPY